LIHQDSTLSSSMNFLTLAKVIVIPIIIVNVHYPPLEDCH
jgi:hypothetical protein